MQKKFKRIIQRIMFQPQYFHVFINHLFIIRRGIFKYVQYYSELYGKGHVLDYGCGSKPYRNLFECQTYIGVDVKNSGHDHSNSEIDYYISENRVPLPDAQFDFVICIEVLEHVDDLDAVLNEISRLLKVGGVLLITTPFMWREHEQPYDFRRLTSFGLLSGVENAGFEVLDISKLGCGSTTLLQLLAEELNTIIKNRLTRMLVQFLIFSIPMLFLTVITSFTKNDPSLYLNNAMIVKKRAK